jgi:hypothetical protein
MRVPVDKRPKAPLVKAEVVPVDAAAVLTLGPDWAGWGTDIATAEPIPFGEGDFVRLRPPSGASEKHARDVRDAFRKAGASVVLELAAQVAPVLPGEAPLERPHLRTREVVQAVVEEGASPRKADLRALVEGIMDKQGL